MVEQSSNDCPSKSGVNVTFWFYFSVDHESGIKTTIDWNISKLKYLKLSLQFDLNIRYNSFSSRDFVDYF